MPSVRIVLQRFCFLPVIIFLTSLSFASSGTTPSEQLWMNIFQDIIEKYDAHNPSQPLCPSTQDCLEKIKAIPFETRENLSLPDALLIISDQNTSQQAFKWLHEKYGVTRDPLFRKVDPKNEGSYHSARPLSFKTEPVHLPKYFDPQAKSSIQDLDAYLERKWGGLQYLANPSRIIVSMLGSSDTISGLQSKGFTDFFVLNAPYSMRGSKALLAYPGDQSTHAEPTLVFYSFVGKDLLAHKLMQLSLYFKDAFNQITVLSSNGKLSWDVANLRVETAFSDLLKDSLPSDIMIDDFIIGYPGPLSENFRKIGKPFEKNPIPVGDFAELELFSVTGKNGINRTVALLSSVKFRYFGKAIIPLVRPMLSRGVNRVIFAGSAGSLDPQVPVHSLIIPRSFHLVDEHGGVGARIPISNDLYNLLPYGPTYSGKHLSVSSPLAESQDSVKKWRDQDKILSVDVEGAQLAQLVSNFNQLHGTAVRIGALFVVTDTPTAEGESVKKEYGLHRPNFNAKAEAKAKYVASINLLFDIQDKFDTSQHYKIITKYFSEKIKNFKSTHDNQALSKIYFELKLRLKQISQHNHSGIWTTRGLEKGYQDLIRDLEKYFNGKTIEEPISAATPIVFSVKSVDNTLLRVMLLQSLSRSSTVNSGDVAHDTGNTQDQVRRAAINGANSAVDFLLSKQGSPLLRTDIEHLHKLLNHGAMAPDKLGKISSFHHNPIDTLPVSSEQALNEYLQWLHNEPVSIESALEAFLRFEEIHPFADGNGRVAEMIAQHRMIQATGAAFLFPNRFDIEYILSLKRNGSTPNINKQYLAHLLENSKSFYSAIIEHIDTNSVERVALDTESGLVCAYMKNDSKIVILPVYSSLKKIKQQREQREFLSNDTTPYSVTLENSSFKNGSHLLATRQLQYSEYQANYNFYEIQNNSSSADTTPIANFASNPEKATLVLGGSFSPPTKMHLALMADTLYEEEFFNGILLVANPYKPGAVSGEISLNLTQIAVENFYEILDERNIPYRDFKVEGPGKSSWIGKHGKRVTLSVSDFDVKNKVTSSLTSIEYFSKQVGDPSNMFWLSGGDSAASMPQWGPWWEQMFANTNMIFTGRASQKGERTIDDSVDDALQGIYPPEFLNRYKYSKIGKKQIYFPNSPTLVNAKKIPGIFIKKKLMLNFSSTQVRASLPTEDQRDAQFMLSRAVYRAILETQKFREAYKSAREWLTFANLSNFLREEFNDIERNKGNSIKFQELTQKLVDMASTQFLQSSETDQSKNFKTQLGDKATAQPLSPRLQDLRNRLVRGTPESIISRVIFHNCLALACKPMPVNLIQSRMSDTIPLSERRKDNANVTWHDLNLSTNELKAMLANPILANSLKVAAQDSLGAYANFLVSAIIKNPESRLRLELFLTRRYFNRMILGDIREELFSGMTTEEQNFTRWAKTWVRDQTIRNKHFRWTRLEAAAQSITDFYIVIQFAKTQSNLINSSQFWNEFIHLMLTDYPGMRANLDESNNKATVSNRLTILGALLESFKKNLLSDHIKISIPESSTPKLKLSSEQQIIQRLAHDYLGKLLYGTGPNLEKLTVFSNEKASLEIDRTQVVTVQTLERGDNIAANMIWDIHSYDAQLLRDVAYIERSYQNALTTVDQDGSFTVSKADLDLTQKKLLKKFNSLRAELMEVHNDWLHVKDAFDVSMPNATQRDTDLEQYSTFRRRYRALRSHLKKVISDLESLNQVVWGIQTPQFGADFCEKMLQKRTPSK